MHFVALKGIKKSEGISNIMQMSCDVLLRFVMSGTVNDNVTTSCDETVRQLGFQPGKRVVLQVYNDTKCWFYVLFIGIAPWMLLKSAAPFSKESCAGMYTLFPPLTAFVLFWSVCFSMQYRRLLICFKKYSQFCKNKYCNIKRWSLYAVATTNQLFVPI